MKGCHYCDVVIGSMASQIQASRSCTQSFIQAQIKEDIKAPRHRHWPLCGEFTGDRPVTWKMFPCDNVIMWCNNRYPASNGVQLIRSWSWDIDWWLPTIQQLDIITYGNHALTNWGRDKIVAIFPTAFSDHFLVWKRVNVDEDPTEVCS